MAHGSSVIGVPAWYGSVGVCAFSVGWGGGGEAARQLQYSSLVSHDDDFLRLIAEGQSHAGFVYIPRERSVGYIVRELVRLATTLSQEELRNQVEFV